MSLTKAEEALAQSDLGSALVNLLEVWRATRSVRVAEAIDVVSHRMTKARSIITTEKEWIAIEKARDVGDLGRLLAAALPSKGTDLAKRVARLVTWPDDPRLASWLSTNLERFQQGARVDVQPRSAARLAVARLGELGDRRTIAALRRSLALGSAGSLTAEALRAVERRALGSAAVPVDASSLDRIKAKACGTQGWTESDFLEAIARDPEDLAQKQAFVDWLMSNGSPRGELVRLLTSAERGELDKADEDCLRRLLVEHSPSFAGPLHRWLTPVGRRYEYGLLVAGEMRSMGRGADTFADPMWRVVRDVSVSSSTPMAAIERMLTHPHLAKLKGLHGISVDNTRTLAAKAPLPSTLEVLTIRATPGAPSSISALGAARSFPSLRVLCIDVRANGIEPPLRRRGRSADPAALAGRGFGEWHELLASPLGQRLERLDLLVDPEAFEPLLFELPAAVRSAPRSLRVMTVATGEGPPHDPRDGWEFQLSRTQKVFDRLTATWLGSHDRVFDSSGRITSAGSIPDTTILRNVFDAVLRIGALKIDVRAIGRRLPKASRQGLAVLMREARSKGQGCDQARPVKEENTCGKSGNSVFRPAGARTVLVPRQAGVADLLVREADRPDAVAVRRRRAREP